VIYCCSPLDTDFEYFVKLENEEGLGNLAILDVASSFTNNKRFPSLPGELGILKELALLKN
jgi:hypothetical protein